jgi:hypothetical protein
VRRRFSEQTDKFRASRERLTDDFSSWQLLCIFTAFEIDGTGKGKFCYNKAHMHRFNIGHYQCNRNVSYLNSQLNMNQTANIRK